jgi:hypothetical protein
MMKVLVRNLQGSTLGGSDQPGVHAQLVSAERAKCEGEQTAPGGNRVPYCLRTLPS